MKQSYVIFLTCASALILSHGINGALPPLPNSIFDIGISRFLKDVFNTTDYGENFLPNNFTHLKELIEYGKKTNQSAPYYKSVLRLFINKPLPYVNAYAFADLLGALPDLLQDRMTISKSEKLQGIKDIVNEMLYTAFLSHFPDFKANPGAFLDDLSQEIEDAVELRKLLMLFLHSTLHKLIWSPEDNSATWDLTKMIAERMQELHNRSMIADQDDLNTLFVMLTDRYCFFLDLTNEFLKPSFFETVKADIASQGTPLLLLEEQEELLQTKTEKLLNCLMLGHAKALEREHDMTIRAFDSSAKKYL